MDSAPYCSGRPEALLFFPRFGRNVVIRPVLERYGEVSALFNSLGEGMAALCARYSEADLKVIVDYMTRSAELFRRETQRLRADDTPPRNEPKARI